MADAPFLIRPPNATHQHHALTGKHNTRDGASSSRRQGRESGRGLSLGTVHGDNNIDGTLYWNQDVTSSGLVCGTSSKQVSRTVMQMVRLHLHERRDSSALIFHASSCDHLLPSSRVNIVQLAKRLSCPSVFLSPRASPAVKARYLQIPLPEQDVLPLRIAEKDISIAHILSFCTPPSDYPSRERILTSVQYIVSRMTEPFSILEFNQMVDDEQWDEHGSSFMAIRQTLLTTFIVPNGSTPTTSDRPQKLETVEPTDIVSRILRGGPVIVDLSDPILRSTGLDSTLFDMILCLYCMVNPESRKLLVLDANEYLANPLSSPSSGTNLCNTLTTLLSLHGDSPIKTLLSCSSDMAYIPQQLLSHLDYLICHEFRSPAWVEYIQKYFFAIPSSSSLNPSSNANQPFSTDNQRHASSSSLYTLEDRHAIIISPRSLLSEAQRPSLSPIVEEDGTPPHAGSGTKTGTKWGARAFRVEIGWEWPLSVEQQKIEQLQALVAQLSQISQNRDHHRESMSGSVRTDAGFKATTTTAVGGGAASDGGGVANSNAPEAMVAESVVPSTTTTANNNAHRRSRKESSTHMETTMTALKSALGYLAARRAVDLSSPPSSPKENGTTNGLLPLVLPSSRTPPPMDSKADKLGNMSGGDTTDPSTDDAEWLRKRGLDAKFTMPPRVRSLQDLGPFPAETVEALEIDNDKLSEALLEAIIRAGGERGMPISSQKVAEQYRRLTTEASTQTSLADSRLSMWNGVPALTGFSTWVETINYAQKQGILQLISNGKEDWVVMPKDSVQSRPMSVVQSPDGWYETRIDVEPPQEPVPEPHFSPKEVFTFSYPTTTFCSLYLRSQLIWPNLIL
ncbi:hypothetical protein M408DRAFT_291545 [Serendipita vermifera MAFF 305830]|uniref:Uncharacterized protein n=1 Tax=Serendipita vermifera MAFF 305830 TaxID=933852 RepID=A0A0C2W759_SERVB|nr:hypothetical protein M408DRAFT_291545 [Serendipita vermifera MAFF 305830]